MDTNNESDLNVEINKEVPCNMEDTQTKLDDPLSIDRGGTEVLAPSSSPCLGTPMSMGESDGCATQILNIQIQDLVSRLSVGNVVSNLDEAYLMYCEYARLLGFSVKRGTQSYFQKTDVIRMKMYFCSSVGRSDNRASDMKIACYKKQHTRTECKARLRISRQVEGPWIVTVFETEHNHELLGHDDSYLLRSSRNLCLAKRSILETFNDAGIGVSKAYRFVKNQVRGPQNVGYTRKDAYDHINRIRKVSKLGNADADALMRYFQNKSATDPFFFWRVLLDDDGRIMNLFFRDSRCALDYALFGDVVSVDTTFRTNKYNLICAPFVGMNHHRHTTMFGIGFLSDETTESFEWLFTVFLESMEGKEPSIIFSDQDQALMNGIDFAFQSTAHRLCQWHINQNAPSHFGKLNGVKEFKEMWFKCMNRCEDEDEFETVWNTMVAMYDLQSNNWFNTMYELRWRWADVFTNSRFSGGLHATSRSELTNKVIKDMCAASTSLIEFVTFFERICTEWRVREREEDVFCRGTPGQCIYGNRLLNQAAKTYTRNVYKLFEKEAMMSLNVDIVQGPPEMSENNLLFLVHSSGSKHTRKVEYKQLADEVSCTCAMLTTQGMFCKHILKVLYFLNVPSLPTKYILKRWTRDAKKDKKGASCIRGGHTLGENDELLFVNHVMRKTYNLALEFKDVGTARELIMQTIDSLSEKLHNCTLTPRKNATNEGEGMPNIYTVRNPPSPEHRWLPPKRRSTVYKGKRKGETTQQKKGVKVRKSKKET